MSAGRRARDGRQGVGWQLAAACRSEDPELFYEPIYEDQAKEVCDRCPVRQPCLLAAIAWEGLSQGAHRSGVWGGLTAAERQERLAVVREVRAAA